MGEDSLVAARKIRQPIVTKDDISNAFDGITYQKGASVIRMFESWVGEKKFQAGVTAYLKRYSYKNARVSDFLDSIAATGQPQLTRAFSTYLEQPGFPLISVNLNCSAAPALSLTQKRYLPAGSTGNASQVWQTPVCVRYQTAKGDQKECFLLDKPAAEFRLTHATSCPANLSANADAAGNYITRYDSALLPKLLAGDYLNAAERMTLLNDLTSLLNAGEIPQGEVLTAAAAFAKSPERQIVGLAQGAVSAKPAASSPPTCSRITPASCRRRSAPAPAASAGPPTRRRLRYRPRARQHRALRRRAGRRRGAPRRSPPPRRRVAEDAQRHRRQHGESRAHHRRPIRRPRPVRHHDRRTQEDHRPAAARPHPRRHGLLPRPRHRPRRHGHG